MNTSGKLKCSSALIIRNVRCEYLESINFTNDEIFNSWDFYKNFKIYFEGDEIMNQSMRELKAILTRLTYKEDCKVALMAHYIQPGCLFPLYNQVILIPSRLKMSTVLEIRRYLDWFMLPMTILTRRLTRQERKKIVADVLDIMPRNMCALRVVLYSINDDYYLKSNTMEINITIELSDNVLIGLSKFVEVVRKQTAELEIPITISSSE